jgi:hypothetical protein
MAKRVFFSFHYEDVKTFRANVVRNHDLTKESREDCGFFDASIWENAKLYGDSAVKKLIEQGLTNTSVTCVLLGSETWKRRWVRYEVLRSYDRGNRLLGVHINGVRDKNQQTFPSGKNIFDFLGFTINSAGTEQTYYERETADWRVAQDIKPKRLYNMPSKFWGRGYTLSTWVNVYDWATQDGYNNFPTWLDNAT